MKTLLIILTTLTIAGTSATSQQDRGSLTCSTTDGVFTVTERNLQLRDYIFSFDRVAESGVIILKDSNADAIAVLDTRGEEGIYLAITESGVTMQVVAPRAGMTFIEPTNNGFTPSEPSASTSNNGNLLAIATAVR